ncbi:MAG: hypothetical protein P8M65_05580 [Roseibacillus sp.]|nr:hypothetical protein [Roseibacillus sp.]
MSEVYTCRYPNNLKAGTQKIEAETAELAAKIFEEQNPSSELEVETVNFMKGRKRFPTRKARQALLSAEEMRISAEEMRIALLEELLLAVQSASGNLKSMSYSDLRKVIQNLWEFPSVRDDLSSEEHAIRERLYMEASFDESLHVWFQNQLACGQFIETFGEPRQSSNNT